jgi:predicted amidohydrolase
LIPESTLTGKFTVALAQVSPKLGLLKENLQLHLDSIRRAKSEGADLVVFPELSLTGYILQDLVPDVAIDPLNAPGLQQLLQGCRDIACIFGFVEISDRYNYYNAAAYVAEGRIQHVHRKLYLPTYGMFDEMRFFAMGEKLRTVRTPFGPLGLLICEDLWHPSTLYLHVQDGARVVVTLSSSPGRGVRTHEGFQTSQGWEILLKALSQFYTVYNLYANRAGIEDGAYFPGGSMVVGPVGEVIARSQTPGEDLVLAELDLDEIRRARLFTPVLRDERLDLTLRELTRIVRQRSQS